jgi:class 3 adenylate cyclase
VLFADVSGFTTLSERLDPEEIRAFQNALFAKLAEAVVRYDGFVEKFVGDAVMAVFGAPVAHENDPERALRAALDMLEASNALTEQWGARLGRPVTLHISDVHSGPVVTGSLSNAAGAAYAVTGDTVNTTARLLAAASGTVLVSAATHALTHHLFNFEPARELAVRGTEPVVVHRLVGVLVDPGSARGLASHGLTSPMIGRADELEQLLSAFDRMQKDQAQLICVMGEPGTGKSRLIAEFVGRLEVDGRLARTTVRRAAYNALGVAHARTGRLAEAVPQIEQSVDLAEAHGLSQAACRGYTNLGVLYSSLDPPRSIEACQRGLETARKVGDLGFQSRLYANLAVAYCALTDRCEAEGVDAARKAIDLDRRLGLVDHLAVPLIVLGQIHQCHGERGPVLAAYEEALALAEHVDEPQLLFPCYDGLATLYLDDGNLTVAESYLVKSKLVCERAGLEPDALMVLTFFC